MIRPTLISVFAALAVLSGCDKDEVARLDVGSPCEVGVACPAGHACFQGMCRPEQGTICDESKARCVTGFTCEGGVCVGEAGALCAGDKPCATAFACESDRCAAGPSAKCAGVEEIPCQSGLVCEDSTCHVAVGGACGAVERPCAEGLVCEGEACRADAGGACLRSEDCTSGFACHAGSCLGVPGSACSAEAPCAPGGECAEGKCVGAIGGACARTRDCGAGLVCESGVCLGEVGSECGESAECADGLRCAARTCRAGAGDACAATSDCVPRATCVDGTCRGALGTACRTSAGCAAGLACDENTCRATAGGECGASGDCAGALTCEAGHCRAAPGGACAGEDECPAGSRCDEGVCAAAAGRTCSAAVPCVTGQVCDAGTCRGGWTAACEATRPCAAGLVCDDGRCVSDLGGSCAATIQPCAAGLVCSGGTCAGGVGRACQGASGCGAGLVCAGGACRVPAGNACADAAECVSGTSCLSGRCVLGAGDACAADTACADAYACFEGTCRPRTGSPCGAANACLASDLCESGTCVANRCLAGTAPLPRPPTTITQPALVCPGTRTTVSFSGEDCDALDLSITKDAQVLASYPAVQGKGSQQGPVLDTEGEHAWAFVARRSGCQSVQERRAFRVARPTAPTLTGAATACETATAQLTVSGAVANRVDVVLTGPGSFSQTFANVAEGALLTSSTLPAPGRYTWTATATIDGCTAAVATKAFDAATPPTADCPLSVPTATLVADAGTEFGAVPTGDSKQLTFTYTNTSATLPLERGPIALSDPAYAVGTSSTCNSAPATMAPGASCRIDVRFTPSAAGVRAATLSVASNGFRAPHRIGVSGTGATPIAMLELSPTSLDFGPVAIGSNPTASITLRNKGGATASIAIGAPTTAAFVRNGGSCITLLGAGATCTVGIQFKPAAVGTVYNATFPVTFGALNEKVDVQLRGSGITPEPTKTIASQSITKVFSNLSVTAAPYVPFSIAGLVTIDEVSSTKDRDGYVFVMGAYANLSNTLHQLGVTMSNGRLCAGYAYYNNGTPFAAPCPIVVLPSVTPGQVFHLAVEAASATSLRIAVNGEFKTTYTIPNASPMPDVGRSIGVGTPNQTHFGLKGLVTNFKYWQGVELWKGANFDYTAF